MSDTHERSGENQQVQQDLVEQAKQMPGVADALAAYEQLQRVAVTIQPATSKIRHSTGANS
jgi:ribosomal protein L21E